MALRAVAEVNLAAIERNTARLRERIGAHAQLCAVVKADGYGHGAVPSARAALRGGASVLAVATADEAGELRGAGLEAPILVLGAVSEEELPIAVAAGAELVVWDQRFVEQLRTFADSSGASLRVHVKLDTGLGRLGTREPEQALAVAHATIDAAPELQLAGVMTHFATSDSDQEFVAEQLAAFQPFVAEARALARTELTAHAANSAATLLTPSSHFDMVRPGITLYGGDPMNNDPADHGLEPALALRTYVAAVKPIAAGESTGYGRRFIADRDSHIATLPIGYGDGVVRAMADNCDVLIGGRRYPLRGMVSMDNITVDVGPEPVVQVGDRATLIGTDGDERQTAEDLARRIGTISYEVLCWISRRVPRVYHYDGSPA
ncbi:MAG TPA: alanine racemase [Solirubrobacteraceae bacterium]|jgi:alanine racemase|nr:alanine racemase [Solirubrobacteraceae bacterium]